MAVDVTHYRKREYGVNELFINRWSPRAMSGEAIKDEELMRLFEAARWAPSAFNNQPWRFVFAKRESSGWPLFLELMTERNRSWSGNASVLMVIVSKDTFDHSGKPARTHSYDTGAAWMSLALEGSIMGLVVHGMQGFDYEKARQALGVPEGFTVEAMAAVGRPGNPEELPEEIRKAEYPKGRKEFSEILFENTFAPDDMQSPEPRH